MPVIGLSGSRAKYKAEARRVKVVVTLRVRSVVYALSKTTRVGMAISMILGLGGMTQV